MNKIKLSPSILTADFARLGAQVEEAAAAGADYLHVDIMDGHFVPNITIGPMVMNSLRAVTGIPFDTHLMLAQPERYIEEFARAGATIMSVHYEACLHLHRVIQQIKATGAKAGVVLNPATPVGLLEEILPYLDQVMLMSVNPGYGGQAYIETTTAKIRRCREMIDKSNPGCDLEVDGGVGAKNIQAVIAAGATVIVAGSAVYNKQQTVEEAIQGLRLIMEV